MYQNTVVIYHYIDKLSIEGEENEPTYSQIQIKQCLTSQHDVDCIHVTKYKEQWRLH